MEQPVKSENDKKLYRSLCLDNGLKVLLIHDPDRNPGRISQGSLCESMASVSFSEEEETTDDELMEEEEEDVSTLEVDKDLEEEQLHKMRDKGKCDAEKLAAAALSIRVGGFQDPEDLPGFCHFLEHMVFMGSEKYTSENEFDDFVTTHGGNSNAHTTCEETVFVFDVLPKHFEGALDRFAQFFISPLLLKDSMERELKAVDSEFEMAVPSDSVRKEQILQSIVQPGHPMGKFMWGNSKSIYIPNDPDGTILNQRLNEYRQKYYLANRMNLVLQSRHTLDELEEIVRKIFSAVPSGPKPPGVDYSGLPPPFDVPEYNKIFKVAPVKDLNEVELRWALPTLLELYRSKPLLYLSHIIGHEGEGSLMSYLRKNLWATSLESGTDESNDQVFNSIFSEYIIKITLTEEGFKNIKSVIEAVISFISLVKMIGPREWEFNELKLIDEINFRFIEESPPFENVESIVSCMHYYKPSDYLTGLHLFKEYNPELICECLDYLKPEKMNIIILHKDFTEPGFTDKKERWVGANYRVEDISNSWLEHLMSLSPRPEFRMPESNPFLAKNFEIFIPIGAEKYPEKILETTRGTLWFRQDYIFRLPKASLGLYLISPFASNDPSNAAGLDLLAMALQQDTMEELYAAHLANLEYSISADDRGLVVKTAGFNDKLDVLLGKIFEHIFGIESRITDGLFKVLVDQLKKKYKNSLLKPSNLVKDIRLSLLIQSRSLLTDKLNALERISKDAFIQYILRLRGSLYVQALFQGNLIKEKATNIFEMVTKWISSEVQNKDLLLKYKVYEIMCGEKVCRSDSFNPTDPNSVTVNYYQWGISGIREAAILEALIWLMEEPVFNQLRTQEQLGYHVSSSMLDTHGVVGFTISVYYQIFKFNPEHINERIEAFLQFFHNFLSALTTNNYMERLTSLIKKKERPDVSLDEEFSRNWDEIERGEFMFDRLQKTVEVLKNVTLDEIKDMYQKLFCYCDNEKFRKISFEVLGRQSKNESGMKKASDFELALLVGEGKRKYIDDFRSFQSSLLLDAPVVFDTRSLDRPKKTKNSNQEQNNSWSKTLPSTKNKLDSKGKKKDFVEKNNKLNALKSKLMRTNSSSNEILDTIQETNRETLNNSYIKGLERNNLRYSDKNLSAKISNEEIAYKRQYSSENLDRMPTKTERIDRYKSHGDSPERSNQYVRSYSRNETDPLHSMPGGLIEPIYSLGFTHNRNRPFSYTTGMSPELEKPNKYEDSYKQHSDDRNIYHSTQKVMEKDAILLNKNRNYRESNIPFKENISRPLSIDPTPDMCELGRENSKFQPNKTVNAKEQFGPPLSNKYSKEGKDGYTTKIMINVNHKNGNLNSAQLVRDASDASQTVGIKSSRLVRQAHNEPPSRPLRAKEKKGENTIRQSVHGNENGHSKLAQRTATLGRVPSQREVPDKRDKRRKVKIVFEYKKASNNEGDPLSRFVEYKGSDLRFTRPVTKELNPMMTLGRPAKAEHTEETIRRHKSEQRFPDDAFFNYDRRARSLSPDKIQFGSYDDPEREERIRRQRDKFLTAFFGPGKIPGIMSDENVTRPENRHIKYQEDDRRRVLSNPDLTTLRRRQFSESPVRDYEKAKSKNKKRAENYDRRDGYGKNRSPVRNGTSESDEGAPRRNLRHSRIDLAGSLTPPSDYDSSSYSSNGKYDRYKKGSKVTRYGETRSGNPIWTMTVNPPKENLERKNSDFSESDRDYRREMVTKKSNDLQQGIKWGDSLTLNRLEVKNKKNREKQNTKTDERSETLRRRRMHSSTDVVDNGRPDNHPRELSEPVKPRGNRKTVRYFGDTDLESEKNSVPFKSVLKQEPSVRRTASSISTSKVGKMDYLKPPELGPHSLSSSLNNSESEGGEGGSQAASASSQRSVYLHATTVADIPVPGHPGQRRRDESSEYEAVPVMHPVAQAHGGQLKNARHVSRSFSVLAPWKPRHYREKFEINYSNRQPTPTSQQGSGPRGKPPRPPRKREVDEDELSPPSQISGGRQVRIQPKESKVSGWFKRKK